MLSCILGVALVILFWLSERCLYRWFLRLRMNALHGTEITWLYFSWWKDHVSIEWLYHRLTKNHTAHWKWFNILLYRLRKNNNDFVTASHLIYKACTRKRYQRRMYCSDRRLNIMSNPKALRFQSSPIGFITSKLPRSEKKRTPEFRKLLSWILGVILVILFWLSERCLYRWFLRLRMNALHGTEFTSFP